MLNLLKYHTFKIQYCIPYSTLYKDAILTYMYIYFAWFGCHKLQEGSNTGPQGNTTTRINSITECVTSLFLHSNYTSPLGACETVSIYSSILQQAVKYQNKGVSSPLIIFRSNNLLIMLGFYFYDKSILWRLYCVELCSIV